ncbi:MAG: hypothetical protein ACREXT_17960 [Gammaproteobacteria bacterium]
MATVTSWAGTITEIGPIYPLTGTEVGLVIVAVAFWVVWHILQIRAENREFEEEHARLKQGDQVRRALEREG